MRLYGGNVFHKSSIMAQDSSGPQFTKTTKVNSGQPSIKGRINFYDFTMGTKIKCVCVKPLSIEWYGKY